MHPRDSTAESIASFQRQLAARGGSRSTGPRAATDEPCYYRWTQWIFLELFRAGLAYRKEAAVKWCPHDQTVLANEQVRHLGRCERCGRVVQSSSLSSGYLRITDWRRRCSRPRGNRLARVRETMQRAWIGVARARGDVRCEALGIDYPVFTTRPDTLSGRCSSCGARASRRGAPGRGDRARAGRARRRQPRAHGAQRGTGRPRAPQDGRAFGRTVPNRVNGEQPPMYVADYVPMEYGAPGRSWRCRPTTRARLRVRQCVRPPHTPRDRGTRGENSEGGLPYSGDGTLVNSRPDFDGMANREALTAIVAWLDREGKGHASVDYRLRDWLVSRQRYWGGAPSRSSTARSCGTVPVGPMQAPPVELPDSRTAARRGRRLSAAAAAACLRAHHCPRCGRNGSPGDGHDGHLRRLVVVLLQVRQPRTTARPPLDRGRGCRVDAGGPVHRRGRARDHASAVSRFFIKASTTSATIDFEEPFTDLLRQGMITKDGAKMSKSKAIRRVAAASTSTGWERTPRGCYVLFMGPPDQEEW